MASCFVAVIILASPSMKSSLYQVVGSSRVLSTMGHGRDTKAAPTCNDGMYSKHTLQLAYELPFAGLFDRHNRGQQQKYEASSVIIVREIVCHLVGLHAL